MSHSKRVRVRVYLMVPVACDVDCTWDPEEETAEVHKINVGMGPHMSPDITGLMDEEYQAIDAAAKKAAEGG